MPDFRATTPTFQFGGILASPGRVGNVAPEIMEQASRTGNQREYGLIPSIAGYVGLGAVDLVDTVSSSVMLTDRGTINSAVVSSIGSPGLTQFASDNEAGIQMTSGIIGAIGAIWTGGRSASGLFSSGIMRRSSIGRVVGGLERQHIRALAEVRRADNMLAARGISNIDEFNGVVTFNSQRLNLRTGAFQASRVTATRAQLATRAERMGQLRGLRDNLYIEGVMAATLNQHEMLYSEDLGENLAWMAGGIAIGGIADRIITNYAMRRTINTQNYQRVKREALDPLQMEQGRLTSATQYLSGNHGWDVTPLDFQHSGYIDRANNLAINADAIRAERLNNLEGVDRAQLRTHRDQFATTQLQSASNELNKATIHGLPYPNTSFSMGTEAGPGGRVMEIINGNPSAFTGSESIGVAPRGTGIGTIVDRMSRDVSNQLDEVQRVLGEGGRWTAKSTREANEAMRAGVTGREATETFIPLSPDEIGTYGAAQSSLFRLAQQEMLVNLGGEEFIPASVARIFDNFLEPEMKFSRLAKGTTQQLELTRPGGLRKLLINENGEVALRKGEKIEDLSLEDTLTLYRGARRFAADGGRVTLGESPGWFQIDFAEMVRRNGGEVVIGGTKTLDDMIVESFAQKVDILKAASGDIDELEKMRLKLNLPQLSAAERALLHSDESPYEIAAKSFASGDEVRELSKAQLLERITGARRLTELSGLERKANEEVLGRTYDFMLDNTGKRVDAILTMKRPYAPFEWTKDHLMERIAVRKTIQLQALTSPSAPVLNQNIVGTALKHPDYEAATHVERLSNLSLGGSLFGRLPPQTEAGQWANSVVTREFRDRDSPVMLAAQRQQELRSRLALGHMEQVIQETKLGEVMQNISGPRNRHSAVLYSQFKQHRSGWDLDPKMPVVEVELPNGKGFAFTLDDQSPMNHSRWEQMTGEKMAPGQTLQTPEGVQVVLDELGMEFTNAFQKASDDLLANKNNLLDSNGLGQIPRSLFYTPPPTTEGKFVAWTFDTSGNAIPNGGFVAETQQQLSAMIDAALRDEGALVNKVAGAEIRSRTDVTNFLDLFDRAQMEWNNPGLTARQPGKQGKGLLTSQQIDLNGVEESMRWLRSQYIQHGNDLGTSLMREPLESARQRSVLAAGEQAASGRPTRPDTRNIFDYYAEATTGKMGITDERSRVGRFYKNLPLIGDRSGNQVLKDLEPTRARVWGAVQEFFRRPVPWSRSKEAATEFERLSQALGEHMPFKSQAELVAARTNVARPKSMDEIASGVSQFEAAWILRMGETAHAVMNLSGIVNAMPAVARYLERRPGETVAKWSTRIGHDARIFGDETSTRFGMLDPGKILAQTYKSAFRRKNDPRWAYRSSMGYMHQEVAEINKLWHSVDSKNSLMKALTGDTHYTSSNPAIQGVRRKGIVGSLSVISDKSEDFSRSWGHLVGVEIAQRVGIQGMEAQEAFGHDIANRMIANYSPTNRPEIFQGALGSSIGLFQSFVWNYYQRLFRYIETRDGRALATQISMQSALFGVPSLPGWDIANDFFMKNSEGDSDPLFAIHENYGQEMGDLISGGIISNIPKIFGMPGVDLYSRGDVNIRLPGFNPPPVIDTARKMFGAMGQAMDTWANGSPGATPSQYGEIMSNALPSRPLSGAIEQAFLGGNDTDRYGQLVSSTQSAAESVYRVLGLRSMRQQVELEAYYANKSAQEIDNAMRDRLNRASRAAIRAGDHEMLPRIFEQYVENGGNPRHYGRWIRSNYDSATTPNSQRQLEGLLSNPENISQVRRLLEAGVTTPELNQMPDDFGSGQEIADEERRRSLWTQTPTPGATELRALGFDEEDDDTADDYTFDGDRQPQF